MVDEKIPGLRARPRRDGTQAFYWIAASMTRDTKDFPNKTVRVFGSREEMAARCQVLTAELRQWTSRKGPKNNKGYDGTVRSLIRLYQQTPESSYYEVRHNTRRSYDFALKVLEIEVGAQRLRKLNGLDFKRWFNQLKMPATPGGPERPRRAYSAIQLLRIIIGFGVVTDTPECSRLSNILRHMEFKSPGVRRLIMTFAQARAICLQAIEDGRVSIALAQALQFELTLRQSDVIGIWEPITKGEAAGGIVDRGRKWRDGLLWSHIDDEGILTKETSKTGQIAVHDTTRYPFLRSMIDIVPVSERVGPIIVSEVTGLPYRYRFFRDTWRDIADKAGVPAEIWNRDSRAGGVTEGSDAGADLEHLRHHANHENIQTTKRYNRNTLEKTRTVADLRVAARERSEKTDQ